MTENHTIEDYSQDISNMDSTLSEMLKTGNIYSKFPNILQPLIPIIQYIQEYIKFFKELTSNENIMDVSNFNIKIDKFYNYFNTFSKFHKKIDYWKKIYEFSTPDMKSELEIGDRDELTAPNELMEEIEITAPSEIETLTKTNQLLVERMFEWQEKYEGLAFDQNRLIQEYTELTRRNQKTIKDFTSKINSLEEQAMKLTQEIQELNNARKRSIKIPQSWISEAIDSIELDDEDQDSDL